VEIAECLALLSDHGVKTVGILVKVASPENIDIIKNMIRMEGKEPCHCDVVANLANLAASLRRGE
jgi:hypothetical protein